MLPDTPISLSIILPFHHEEKNIAQTLHRLKECLSITHEIILVHDDKDDPTLAVIKGVQPDDPSIRVLINAHRAGVSGAIKTGLEKSLGKYILFMVADDQGAIAVINPMLQLMDQGCDLVSGTRYAKGGSVSGGSATANHLSAWGNRLFCLVTSAQLSDPTCGIKMFRKDLLQKINLTSDSDWTVAFELAIESQYHHLKVAEVAMRSSNRIDGSRSHFNILPRVFNYGQIFCRGVIKLRKN